MKRVSLIVFALICCFVAEAQITIRPSEIFKIPNISRAKYMTAFDDPALYDSYYEINDLFTDLYAGDCTWYETECVHNVVASSALSSQGSASYSAANIYDQNHETAWVEGVKGYGVGQWIEYQDIEACSEDNPEHEIQIDAIKILNGYAKNDKAWSENSRVKRLKVYCNGKPACILELQDSRSLQEFDVEDVLEDFLSGLGKNTLRFEILEVYPGTKYQDTVISEIYFE
jgi:hypothetical protein